MEPIFHDDLLEDPLKAVLSLCVKLDIEAESLLENTLLPNSPEVKILFSLFPCGVCSTAENHLISEFLIGTKDRFFGKGRFIKVI